MGRLPAGSCNEGGNDVGGVPVEGPACAVVAHRRAWIGVGCRFLDVSEGYACIESCGDEAMTQRVRRDALLDACALGWTSHDACRLVTIHPLTSRVVEDGALVSFADDELHDAGRAGCEGDDDGLAALAVHDVGDLGLERGHHMLR